MKFRDVVVNTENRFAIGIEEENGKYYLSIPVSNQYVDYEEYYEITQKMFEDYKLDANQAIDFARQCRDREHDDLLMQKPGNNRGVPL